MQILVIIEPSFSSDSLHIELTDMIAGKSVFNLSYHLDNIYLGFLPDTSQSINLTGKEWDFLIEGLNRQVGIVPNWVFGIDGRTYTIEIANGFNRCQYKLWSPREEDNELCVFINKLLKKIGNNKYLKEYSIKNKTKGNNNGI